MKYLQATSRFLQATSRLLYRGIILILLLNILYEKIDEKVPVSVIIVVSLLVILTEIKNLK